MFTGSQKNPDGCLRQRKREIQKPNDDCIIIELKENHTADEAIQQIKDRQYALRFEGKLGENPEYTGRILAVGIAYNKDDENKRHECKVEVLRERLK